MGLRHPRSMTYSYAWHDSFMYVTQCNHRRDMPHPYVALDPFICVEDPKDALSLQVGCLQKSPIIDGSLPERDLQLNASYKTPSYVWKTHRMPYLHRSCFCKRALSLMALCRKETWNLRHPTRLLHTCGKTTLCICHVSCMLWGGYG